MICPAPAEYPFIWQYLWHHEVKMNTSKICLESHMQRYQQHVAGSELQEPVIYVITIDTQHEPETFCA